MYRKIVITFLVLCICFVETSCNRINDKKYNDRSNNYVKAKYTVYIPKGSSLNDNLSKDKNVAVNYLDDKKSYDKSDVDKIVSNTDKNVKVVIINSNKPGILPVFNRLKEKIPGILTIAVDLPEFENMNSSDFLRMKGIEVALSSKQEMDGLNSAKLSQQLNTKTFLYLSLKDSKNVYENEDIIETENYCKKNNIKFLHYKIDSINDTDDKKLKKLNDIFDQEKNLAVFPSDKSLSDYTLKKAIKYHFSIPDLNSSNDGKVLAKNLNLDLDNKDKFISKLKKEISNRGLSHKIGAIIEGESSLLVEFSIRNSQIMYENRFELGESYKTYYMSNKFQEEFDYMTKNYILGPSYMINRNVVIIPRIY